VQESLNITRGGQRIAWAPLWIVGVHEGHTLIVAPRLHLEQEQALLLSEHTPYAKAFANAVVHRNGAEHEFMVIHATFTLFRNSVPDIENFAMMIPDLARPLPSPGHVIRHTAEMLGAVAPSI